MSEEGSANLTPLAKPEAKVTTGNEGAAGGAGAPGADSEQINLRVRNSNNSEVQFRIKRSTHLRKLMDAYCSRVGVEIGTYRFMFDGNRIGDDDTPSKLEMEDLDVIDAMVFQEGGRGGQAAC